MRIARRTPHGGEQGFTLVELLIVIVIIALLAAITIPVFLSQRDRAYLSTLDADLRHAAIQIETFYVEHQQHPDEICEDAAAGHLSLRNPDNGDCEGDTYQLRRSDGVTIGTTVHDSAAGDGFCITASHASLDDGDLTFAYDSSAEPPLIEDHDCS